MFLFPRKQIHLHDNSNLNVKCDSRVTQQTLKHQALADTEIIHKILESDWLPELPIFNQMQERDHDQIRSSIIAKCQITSALHSSSSLALRTHDQGLYIQ